MKIKMIELLNRIANGKDIPKLIEYKGQRYCWSEGNNGGYISNGLYWLCNIHNNFDEPAFLNDEVEIIEEDKPIEELDMRKMENIVGTEISKFMQGFFESLDEDATKLFKGE